MPEKIGTRVEEFREKLLNKDSPEKKPESSKEWISLARSLFLSKVPKKYHTAKLKDFSDDIDQDSINWDKFGFCLRGKTGIGKTHLATGLARKYFNPDHPYSIIRPVMVGGEFSRYTYSHKEFKWISTPKLIIRIRSSFNGSGETELQILKEMVEPKLLILDDLGAEKVSDFSSSTLYAILSERINELKHTIVTTNQTLEEINTWEPRVASRLVTLEYIKLPDVDRRIQKAREVGTSGSESKETDTSTTQPQR